MKVEIILILILKEEKYILGNILLKARIKTVIVDKKYINNKMQLNMAWAREIGQFINNNRDYLESFDKIVITKAEKYIFTCKDIRHIINLLKNKRILV